MNATDPSSSKPEATPDPLAALPQPLRRPLSYLTRLPQDVKAASGIVVAMTTAAVSISQLAPQAYQGLAQALVLGILCITVLVVAFIAWRLRSASAEAAVTWPTPLLRGLLPFDDRDVDEHHRLPGRTSDVDGLYAQISSQVSALTIVRGPAGCGKTSIVRAGLIPRLVGKGYRPIYVSLTESDPDKLVEEKLLALVPEDVGLQEAAGLSAKLAAAGRALQRDSKGLVLVCDQVENAVLQVSAKHQSRRLEALGRYVRAASNRVHLVLVIRDTAWAPLVRALTESVASASQSLAGTSPIDLLLLTSDEAKAVLQASVRRGDADFDRALIAALLRDLDQPGGVCPALLQIIATLLRDHDVKSVAEYRLLRGRTGLLSMYVTTAIKKSLEPALALQVLSQVVTPTDEGTVDADPQRIQRHHDVVTQLMHEGILSVTPSRTYELTYPLFRAPVLAAISDIQDVTKEIAQCETLLSTYVAQRDDGRVKVIPEHDLKVITQKAPVHQIIEASVRRLLIKSQQAAASKRRIRRLAVGAAGVVSAMCLLLAGAYLMARTGYREIAAFETADETSGVRSTVSSLAIDPSLGLAIMSLKGESYGLYMYRYRDADRSAGAIRSDEGTDRATQIAGSERTSFSALSMAPKGDFMVSGGSDGAIRLWDLSQLKPRTSGEPDDVDTPRIGEGSESIRGTRLLRGPLRGQREAGDCKDPRIVDAAFDATGGLFLTGAACGLVELWERDGGGQPPARVKVDGKIEHGDIALNSKGDLIGVRTRKTSDDLISTATVPPDTLRILRRTDRGLEDVYPEMALPDDVYVVTMQFDDNDRLTLVAYAKQELRVLKYDTQGQLSAVRTEDTDTVDKARLAVLTRGAETVGFKSRDAHPSHNSTAWVPASWLVVDLDRSMHVEQQVDELAGAALSADGKGLVLWGSKSVAVYRRGSYVGPFQVSRPD